MKAVLYVLLGLALTVPSVAQAEDCYPESAPYDSYNTIPDPMGIAYSRGLFYIEERDSPSNIEGFPVPGAGTLHGGTWVYRESNGLYGLQRGGVGLLGDRFPPGCTANWDVYSPPATYPCLIANEDPTNDDTCGYGPDTLIISTWIYP